MRLGVIAQVLGGRAAVEEPGQEARLLAAGLAARRGRIRQTPRRRRERRAGLPRADEQCWGRDRGAERANRAGEGDASHGASDACAEVENDAAPAIRANAHLISRGGPRPAGSALAYAS